MKETASTNNSRQALAIFVAVLLMAIGYSVTSYLKKDQQDLPPVVAFQFDTYCAINNLKAINLINAELAARGIQALKIDYSLNSYIFVVIVQAHPSNSSDPNSQANLYYCGVARQWFQTNCNNARFVCSAPGPMFDFKVREESTIIWINAINTTGLNWTESSCYANDSKDQECTTTTKTTSGCSFFSPTDYRYGGRGEFRVQKGAVPISPHIHGLEVRPVFDGNPLGWFAPDGTRGSGFQTLSEPNKYFAQFRHVDTFNGMQAWGSDLLKRTKIISVPNDQAPGLLFYHDHAMKSTLYNVQHGLGGLWVIRDPQAEAGLPSGKYQKFIVFSKQGDARTSISPDAFTAPGEDIVYQRGATYRFRILNAAFDNSFNNVIFAAYYTETIVDGKVVVKEIDPSDKSYPLGQNQRLIPFTVIGTDTTLFHESIDEVSFLNFGPAQRVDLLIRFDTELPSSVNNVYFVCDDMNEGATVIKYQFQIEPVPQTFVEKMTSVFEVKKEDLLRLRDEPVPERLKMPTDYKTLNVPFTDLSKFPQAQVSVRRQRPLFSLPYDTRFMIGAHYMFEMGATDQAKIGTVDDFYLINNLWEDHPIHIHLVNHQAIAAYSLKRLPSNPNCTLYMLDFFRLAKLPQFQDLDDLQLCNALWGLPDEDVPGLFHSLNSYMREDIVGDNRASGLDVMAMSGGDERYLVGGDCSLDKTHKYICDDTTGDILPHERRWKDTSMVHSYSVWILRVRWASTTYTPQVQPYPYFRIPEEHLVEFPGFVYHCHILPHEDNEMMRSYSLQYSDYYLQTFIPDIYSCAKTSWKDSLQCINNRLRCPAASII